MPSLKSLSDPFILLSSVLNYLLQALLQWNKLTISYSRVCIIQRSVLPIICFTKFNDHATQLFHEMKIMKFVDLKSVKNCILINKRFSCNLPCCILVYLFYTLILVYFGHRQIKSTNKDSYEESVNTTQLQCL